MTRGFVSAKRLIRYFSNSSKLVEHRALSTVREVKMLAVWPSIAEGFLTASLRVICNKNCQVLVKNLNFVAGMTRRFVSAKRLIRYFSNSSKLVEHRAQSLLEFVWSLLEFEKYLMSLLAETKRRVIPATKVKSSSFYNLYF